MATIEEIIKAANKIDWYLVTLCQYGRKDNITYRATFQHRLPNGATESVFSEYADAPDAMTAVAMAFRRCKPADTTIPSRLNKPLERALDANRQARETTGAPGRVLRKGRM